MGAFIIPATSHHSWNITKSQIKLISAGHFLGLTTCGLRLPVMTGPLVSIILIYASSWIEVGCAGNDYEYTYDDTSQDYQDSDSHRLVGASRARIEKIPFLVGWNLNDHSAYSQCTGSLVSQRWVLSAAHCITNLIDTEDIEDCIENTKTKGKHKVRRNSYSPPDIIKCKYTKNKDIKIYPIKPKGAVYVRIADITNITHIEEGKKVGIEYVVRHSQSYRGGGSYGKFGGYDITLVHLEEDAKEKPACLPSAKFKDTGIGKAFRGTEKVNLAGFGKYFREPCITDGEGASKYHYCNSGCKTDELPPKSEACDKFFDAKNTPGRIPDKLTEVIITDKDEDTQHYCYRDVPSARSSSKGWCDVVQDASEMGNLYTAENWGFCSRDCFLDDEANPAAYVLRKVRGVDILEHEMCQNFLNSSIGVDVEVMPHILCIGYVEQFKYQHWIKENGKYKLSKKKTEHMHEFLAGSGIYIRSAGTCKGDSGGPVFSQDDESGDYVILGAVSGGRGRLGNCGGMNNPTHYTRVKHFTPWIKEIMGEDAKEICMKD